MEHASSSKEPTVKSSGGIKKKQATKTLSGKKRAKANENKKVDKSNQEIYPSRVFHNEPKAGTSAASGPLTPKPRSAAGLKKKSLDALFTCPCSACKFLKTKPAQDWTPAENQICEDHNGTAFNFLFFIRSQASDISIE